MNCQGFQELNDRSLLIGVERGERLLRLQGFSEMIENGFPHGRKLPTMEEIGLASNRPQSTT